MGSCRKAGNPLGIVGWLVGRVVGVLICCCGGVVVGEELGSGGLVRYLGLPLVYCLGMKNKIN